MWAEIWFQYNHNNCDCSYHFHILLAFFFMLEVKFSKKLIMT